MAATAAGSWAVPSVTAPLARDSAGDGPGEERGLVAILLALHGRAEPRATLEHVAREQREARLVRLHDQVVTDRRKDEERGEHDDEQRAVAASSRGAWAAGESVGGDP